MSEEAITRCELGHLQRAVHLLGELLLDVPEQFTDAEEEIILIAKEVLSAYPDYRY